MKILVNGNFDNTTLNKTYDSVRYFNNDRVQKFLIELVKFRNKTNSSNDYNTNGKFIVTLEAESVLSYNLNYQFKNASEFLDTFHKLVNLIDNYVYSNIGVKND